MRQRTDDSLWHIKFNARVERIGALELDRLSNILKAFDEQFGTLFDDGDRTARLAHDQALDNLKQLC